MRVLVASLAPDLVINAAAYTAVDKAESEQDLAFAINRDGPANLASVCDAARIPLLHLSTDYIFDGQKRTAYIETDAPAPLSIYGASKLAGEVAVRERLERHIILRTAWVFSTHGTNFVKTILRLSAERPELRVVDDQFGGPTPAGAIADALLVIAAVLRQGATAWGTYHYSGAPVTSWCRFARAIIDTASRQRGRTIPVVPIATADYPTAARRPANSALDCARIASSFGLVQPEWPCALAAAVDALLAM
jgi:dTDP-4-dehydrorhamnose reductase